MVRIRCIHLNAFARRHLFVDIVLSPVQLGIVETVTTMSIVLSFVTVVVL